MWIRSAHRGCRTGRSPPIPGSCRCPPASRVGDLDEVDELAGLLAVVRDRLVHEDDDVPDASLRVCREIGDRQLQHGEDRMGAARGLDIQATDLWAEEVHRRGVVRKFAEGGVGHFEASSSLARSAIWRMPPAPVPCPK
jgi:hypothetical protein